jgi:hypothetical protein
MDGYMLGCLTMKRQPWIGGSLKVSFNQSGWFKHLLVT